METRAPAQERLAKAESSLRRASVFRRRGRDVLQADCEMQRRAISAADKRLLETDRLLDASRVSITEARASRVADRIPERSLTLER